MEVADTAPIFILGISQRSGTNYLADLLSLHPDCGRPSPLWEDHVLGHAELLLSYARTLCRRWSRQVAGPPLAAEAGRRCPWPDRIHESIAHLHPQLCRALGSGVVATLQSLTGRKRLVTKTPSVHNLPLFFDLFPGACLLILVRDGRAVVESGVRSFGWDYESAMHNWARAARTVLAFTQKEGGPPGKYLLVRYEDLVAGGEVQVRRLLDFLGLDACAYDFAAAARLPVKGSSELKAAGEMHWRPVEKGADFDPLGRWKNWPRARHERFNWLAGTYLGQLGYEAMQYGGRRRLSAAWNRCLDAWWALRCWRRALVGRTAEG